MTSEEVCKVRCFVEAKCESYNFGPKEGGGHVCELSDSDAIRDPLDLDTKQGFLYVETQVWKLRVHQNVSDAMYPIYFTGHAVFLLAKRTSQNTNNK